MPHRLHQWAMPGRIANLVNNFERLSIAEMRDLPFTREKSLRMIRMSWGEYLALTQMSLPYSISEIGSGFLLVSHCWWITSHARDVQNSVIVPSSVKYLCGESIPTKANNFQWKPGLSSAELPHSVALLWQYSKAVKLFPNIHDRRIARAFFRLWKIFSDFTYRLTQIFSIAIVANQMLQLQFQYQVSGGIARSGNNFTRSRIGRLLDFSCACPKSERWSLLNESTTLHCNQILSNAGPQTPEIIDGCHREPGKQFHKVLNCGIATFSISLLKICAGEWHQMRERIGRVM